jgi:transposase-like protein
MAPKTPKTLQEAMVYFSDPQRAFDYAVKLRWPDGEVFCPRCGSKKHSFIKTRRIWFCYDCKKQFTVKVKTVFEDSAIGLDKWMIAVWMLVACKNGISSYELGKTIGVTQRTAWFMLQRIRKALHRGSFGTTKLGGPDSELEADEMFVGGLTKNMHQGPQAETGKPRRSTWR